MGQQSTRQAKKSQSKSEFVQLIETHLQETGWTNQELMSEIKVGETQFYRWSRGDSVPRKSIVNRIAVALAHRLDQVQQKLPHNPCPGSDQIEGILNELLLAAGYSASVKGKDVDSSWRKIDALREWTLGYTFVSKYLELPKRPSDNPTGSVIEYAERVGRLLGIKTEWKYLTYEEIPHAIRSREVDGVAPFMLVLPWRFFDFRFSDPCGEERYHLSAVTPSKFIGKAKSLEDLPTKSVQLLYVQGEIGAWGFDFLKDVYQKQAFEDNKEKAFEDDKKALSYLLATAEREEDTIPVLLVDNLTAQNIAANNDDVGCLEIKTINLKTYPAFVFHPDEEKLITAVNSAISFSSSSKIFIKE